MVIAPLISVLKALMVLFSPHEKGESMPEGLKKVGGTANYLDPALCFIRIYSVYRYRLKVGVRSRPER